MVAEDKMVAVEQARTKSAVFIIWTEMETGKLRDRKDCGFD